ncbi:hypothetical protein ES703_65357 [subsurface metagenome]
MALLNYTTRIEAIKTIGEIQGTLAAHGAKSILTDFSADGTVEALSFRIVTPQGDVAVRLPIDPEAVLKILGTQYSEGKLRRGGRPDRRQAVRVAWRIVKDWVEAQMAILETEMVKMEQIFLPYVITPGGQTIYEVMVGKGFLLGPGEKT